MHLGLLRHLVGRQVLSWAEDGTLAFQQRTESSAQVRLLDTNGPGGSLQAWSNFTGCVNWRSGSFVDISGNALDNCSNGIFTADNDANAWATITQNLTFMGNHVLGSGDPNDKEGTHQAYKQTYYALIEGNKLDNPT